MTLRVFEDNQACITSVIKGYSPAMRYLARTQRTSIGLLHEIFEEGLLDDLGGATLEYAQSETHKGDQFTKELGVAGFRNALTMIGMA